MNIPTDNTNPLQAHPAALHTLAAETFTVTKLLTRARGGWVSPDVLAACCDRLLEATYTGALRTLEQKVYVVGRAGVSMETFNALSLEALASQSRAADPGLVLRAAALMLHLNQHPDDPDGWVLQVETAHCAIGLADWFLQRLRPTLPAPMSPEEKVRIANAAANAQPAATDPVVANLPPPQNEPADEATATVAADLPPADTATSVTALAALPPDAEDSRGRLNQVDRVEALLGVLAQYAASHPDDPTPTLRTLARSYGFSQEEVGVLAKAYPERLQLDAKPTGKRGGRPSPTLRTHDAP